MLVNIVFSRYYLCMDPIQIHNYIERLGNLLRNEIRQLGSASGLLPVQLEALHYLSICNRFSDTSTGVAEYLGQTKGTVSQTLKVLERKGLIERHVDAADKRVIHLRVTGAGEDLLSGIVPAPNFVKGLETVEGKTRRQMGDSLGLLLERLQQANGSRSFGVCRSCRYNGVDEQGGFFCNLIKAPLSGTDVQRVCREHVRAA